MENEIIVGIDLGTSTSEIAVLKDGKPWVIPDLEGNTIIPSVVGVDEEGNILVGHKAQAQLLTRPDETVFEVKRLMGTDSQINMGGRLWTPEEITAEIIKYLIGYAQERLGTPIGRAVITVPAYFSEAQRRATIEAGQIAGLVVERIINEPTAASLDYGIDHMEDCKNILIYDFGGGTLDVTVLEFFTGVLDVKASAGNSKLGGKDFDNAIIDFLLEQFENKYHFDLSADPRAMMRLRDAAERSKIKLSAEMTTHIILPFIAEIKNEPVALDVELSREQFEDLIRDQVASTAEPVYRALEDAKLKPPDLDLILLVGGTTKIPLVQRFVTELLGKKPEALVDPDLAVARGAAIQAGIISGELDHQKDILITDVCPYTLGISILGEIGGMMMPDVMSVIIKRNTTIPTEQTQRYCTVVDNQKNVEIEVYQGDYKQASQNTNLGTFVLSDLPKAPAGDEKVDVTFAYDINGLLQVTATIASTGKNASITIDPKKTDQLISEQNLEHWQDAPGARRYRRLVQKAEKLLEADEAGYLAFELDRLIKDLKSGLISGQDQEKLEKLRKELNDLVYELEMNQNADE